MSGDGVDLDDIKRRMDGAVSNSKSEFASLRTGRASASMLDPITVDAYGSHMPLNQLATISVPEPRMISVQVWDSGLAAAADKAIRESNLGMNPITEGAVLRIPIPELNEERRQDMVKVAQKYAEQGRVAVRHVRRDGMDSLKKAEKAGDISEDDHRSLGDQVQKLTDAAIAQIDDLLSLKEVEIMQV